MSGLCVGVFGPRVAADMRCKTDDQITISSTSLSDLRPSIMEQGINSLEEVASEQSGFDPAPDDCKLGLPFILNIPIKQTHQSATETVSVASPRTSGNMGSKISELTKEEKKRRRTCKHEGCHNYIVHKGLCCRHGGGKKCSLEGCNSSAKHRGLCWKHGGSVKCKENGCDKKAKARGLCWAHGGGTKCRDAECTKVAVSNGYCWAHGGGKRCGHDGCIKPAYERTQNLCEIHFAQLQNVSYYEVEF